MPSLAGAIRGMSKEKINQKLGFEPLQDDDVSVEKFAFFIKSLKMNILNISSV